MAPLSQINILKQRRGRFIVLEGIDGAGKSTLQKCLAEELSRYQISTFMPREPGGTSLGEQIRDLLKQRARSSQQLTADAELLLMYAARSQLLTEAIEPQLQSGKWVICDRFSLSSEIYQGIGKGVPRARIEYLKAWIVNGSTPDLTFLLDLPAELAWERIQKRRHLDWMEREGTAFFHKLRLGYLEVARLDSTIHVLDAQQPSQKLKDQVLSQLFEWITLWKMQQ